MMTGWEDIRARVLARIRARDWPPGALIPSEEALAQEFGVARATVNRALRDLAEAGLLERRRKAGTRVAALPVRKATLSIPVIRQEVEASGKAHSFTLLSQRAAEPPGDVAALLGLRDGAALIWLETLHLAGAAPFVLEGRWLNPAALPPLPDFSAISANEWLVTQVSYTTGDIAFSASAASPHEAAVLQVPIGAPLFITERSTWTADAPITQVRLAHAPGYRLHTMV